MNTPLVSVIVPFYGVEKYIAACADSILSQTYRNIEFIFVNDGTKDKSEEVLRETLAKYPDRNTRIVVQENAGLPRARAAGLGYASGKYIMHLDSDDWIEPDAVELLVAKAESTGADLVYHDFWKEYSNRSKLDRERLYTTSDKVTYMRRLYRDRAYGYLWNKFALRELYTDVFVPRYNMHEDIVVATQLIFKAQHIERLPVPLVHYRRTNPGASTKVATKKRRGQSARNFLDLYEHYSGSIEGSPVEPVADDIILRAAWVAFSLDRELFAERPYLKEKAKHLPFIPGHRVLLLEQLILKLWLLLV